MGRGKMMVRYENMGRSGNPAPGDGAGFARVGTCCMDDCEEDIHSPEIGLLTG